MKNNILIVGLLFSSSLSSKNVDTLDWRKIGDTVTYRVEYIQLNFHHFAFDTSLYGKTIVHFRNIVIKPNDSIRKRRILNHSQALLLKQIVSDSACFKEGECGTYVLNAGFIVYKGNRIVGHIDMGCGYSDWHITPFSIKNHYKEIVTDAGFTQMEKLLDSLNKR